MYMADFAHPCGLERDWHLVHQSEHERLESFRSPAAFHATQKELIDHPALFPACTSEEEEVTLVCSGAYGATKTWVKRM